MGVIVVYGIAAKTTGRDARDYSDVDLVYDVDDDIDLEYILTAIRSSGVRVSPAREGGEKVEDIDIEQELDDATGGNLSDDYEITGSVGIDRKAKRKGAKKLSLSALRKNIQKDIRNLHWKTPKKERGERKK